MKRISISIIMLMCLFLSVYAKDGSRHDDFWETWPYRFEVRAGWGGFPLMDNILYLSDYKENMGQDMTFRQASKGFMPRSRVRYMLPDSSSANSPGM